MSDEVDSFQDAQETVDVSNETPGSIENNSAETARSASPSKSKKKKNKKKKKNQANNDSQLDLTNGNSEVPVEDAQKDEKIPQDPEPKYEAETDADKPVETIEKQSEQQESSVLPSESNDTNAEEAAAEVDEALKNKTSIDVEVDKVVETAEESQAVEKEIEESKEEITPSIEAGIEKEQPSIEMTVVEDLNEVSEPSEPPISQSTNDIPKSEDLKQENVNLESKLQELKLATNVDNLKQEAEEEKEQKVLQSPSPVLPKKIGSSPPELPDRSNAFAPPPLPERDLEEHQDTTQDSEPPALPQRPSEDNGGLKPFKIRSSQNAADLPPPPLPPQLTAAQKASHRTSILPSWLHKSSSSIPTSEKSFELEENYDLLLSRLSENHEDYQSKDDVSKEQIDISANTLRSTFAERVSSLEEASADQSQATTAEDSEIHKIDWPFWTQVVNDYTATAKADPAKLSKELSGGIPKQIRGIVWQLVANSNPKEFETIFETLKTQTSQYEKSINKDLSRTTFIQDFGLDVDSLFKIIKSYSIQDSEVGYTQGMAFLTVPLLINMNELESFTLLNKLMFGYNIRSLYLPDMPGLHLKLYQFDRLIEDLLPNLHTHLLRQGVRSSMYASQWFLTFFAYKFPIEFVLRIFDIIITEGFESILKFAVAIVQANEAKLLTLNFDDLLEYLKENLFSAYLINSSAQTEDDDDNSIQGGAGGFFTKKKQAPAPAITVDSYDVNKFVEDATNVKILPISLKRYEEEYQEIHRLEKERQEEVEELRLRNNQLRKEIKKIESSYTLLNREHVQIANEMINGRVTLATLEDENKDLKEQNQNLRERIKNLQAKEEIAVPSNLEDDLKITMERNLEVMTKNEELENQVQQLLQEIEELKAAKESNGEQDQAPPQAPPVQKQSSWTKKLFK